MKCTFDDFEETITLYLRADNVREDIALTKIASGIDKGVNHTTLFTDNMDRVNLQIDFKKGW